MISRTMRLYHNKLFAGVALLVVLCLTTPLAQAHNAHARELATTVRTIRVETRTLVLSWSKAKSPLEMVWNKSTSFIEDGHFVAAAKLQEGMQVKVYYHSPFFGKPYLTKVVWNTTVSRTK